MGVAIALTPFPSSSDVSSRTDAHILFRSAAPQWKVHGHTAHGDEIDTVTMAAARSGQGSLCFSDSAS